MRPSRARTSRGQLGRSCSLVRAERAGDPMERRRTRSALCPGREKSCCLVFDTEVCPERPPHDLRLGTALLGGTRFESTLLVLIEVGGLTGEAALRGVLLPRAGRLARFRHAKKGRQSSSGSIHSPCMHGDAIQERRRRTAKGRIRRRAHLLTSKEAAPTDAHDTRRSLARQET